MKYWTHFSGYQASPYNIKKDYDNTIFTFDIESTSFIVLDGKQYNPNDYLLMTEKDQEKCEFHSCMYIWQFSIDGQVYYGRTWNEFYEFIKELDSFYPNLKKIIFVHNLAFEFQFLKSIFHFEDVFARKSHKVIKATLKDFNIEFRCSYINSNASLGQLPKLYNLNVEKLKR